MNKGTHFNGQPMYGQNELDRKFDDDGLQVPAHSSKDIWNYYLVQGIMKTITLKFTCNGQKYEKTGRFEV